MRIFIVLGLIVGAIGCGGGSTDSVGDDDGDPPADAAFDDDPDASPDAGAPDAVPVTCGNGAVETGETCDDGNAATEACAYGETSCTVCDATCHEAAGATSYCGDSTTDAANSEGCDDGNTATELCAYGETGCIVCDATCQGVPGNTSYCSDGITDSVNGETCDDSNTTTEACAYGDTSCTVCDADCHENAGATSYCGDNTQDASNGEACDDGNTTTETCAYGQVSCVVCNAACDDVDGATSYCGDGVEDATNGETCDDSNTTTEACGYGQASCTVCDATCDEVAGATSYCGDSVTDFAAGESCDDGNTTTEACAYGQASCTVCDATCHSAPGATSLCGDAIRDAANGEDCDDGNAITNDGCEPSCDFVCGSGSTATKAWMTDIGCVLRHDTTATQAAAVSACAAEGAELATILSAEQNAIFTARSAGPTMWIGLGDAAAENVWTWTSGLDDIYTNWAGGEPNNSNNEDCVEMRSDGLWNDIACSSTFGYFCLIPSCGDGETDAGEDCDDANRATEECAYGETCNVCAATCELVAGDTDLCNDGTLDDEEACDGEIAGCTGCEVAPGWSCGGSPSACVVGDAAVVGPGAAATVTDGAYVGTVASMTCVPLEIAAYGDGLVASVEVVLGITQTYIGDLVVKLYSPTGAVVTLMSRPGKVETADDGAGVDGDTSDLSAAYPVTFVDGAATSAESMGSTLGSSGVVCRDDAQCRFAPAAGITGTGTLASFVGASAAGTWQLCVGDSATPDAPTIDQVVLYVEQDGAYCGDGFVDAGEECDDGILDGATCDGLCDATADLGVRILQHCDVTSVTLDTVTGAGCHDLSAFGQSSASAIVFDYLGGTAILYDTAGCTGQAYAVFGDQDFCASQYPNGTGLNDRVRSVWLQ